VCPECQYHFRIGAWERIATLTQENSFEEMDSGLKSDDPLKFADVKPYQYRLEKAYEATGQLDAIVTGRGVIGKHMVMLGAFEFRFMGGSMGVVVGERIARLLERAIEERIPAVIVSASGGARMQEGILSLMQMAKTSGLIQKMRSMGLPYISILTDPTTGGVAASFAMLGDVIIAEPGALIGFAGPRVIEQAMRQPLPAGFQRSEFLLKHGFVDMIVHRKDIPQTLSKILNMLKQGIWETSGDVVKETRVAKKSMTKKVQKKHSR
jgi:acetyl-CoA carboxylase carboxyl transferase subunit beta